MNCNENVKFLLDGQILKRNRSEADKNAVLLKCNIKMDTDRNEYLENRQEMLQRN